MKKIGCLILLVGLMATKSMAQIYMADTCRISFFSKTKAEDIDATNTISKPVMSTATGEFDVEASNAFFNFKKELMKEHFNEDYMESAKFPKTVFTGTINEKVDYTKDGTTNVTVTGTLNMHGVKKTITVPGTITVKGSVIFIYAKFNVKIADYDIKIPSFLTINVADNVDITITATMKPYTVKK
jgi:polyisoprenoid-binding protein YceI